MDTPNQAVTDDATFQIQTVSGLTLDLPMVDIGGRSLAYIIDSILSLALAIGWLYLVAYLLGTQMTINPAQALKVVMEDKASRELYVWIGLLPAYLLYLLYHPLLEWVLRGRTPGKWLAGIRIIMQDGTEPRLVPILVRNLFRLIDSLPLFYLLGIMVAMFNKRHLRIGDMAAGTVLIYEDRPRKVEQYLQYHYNSIIPSRHLDLLLELRRRWKGLRRGERVDLATRLLAKVGQGIELEGLSLAEQDRRLQRQLRLLLGD